MARKRSSDRNEFHAQPYQGGNGFYFDSPEVFEEGMERLNKRGIQEVEIQFTAASPDSVLADELLSSGVLDQNNIERWWEDIEDLDEYQKIALWYIVGMGIARDLDGALGQVEDAPTLYEEEAGEAVEQYVADMYGEDNVVEAIPVDELSGYIDWGRVAVAWGTEGRVHEFTYGGKTYTFIGGFR